MNYIKALQNDNAEYSATINSAVEQLYGILSYVNSGKYSCGDQLDGYVSTKDIDSRVREVISNLSTLTYSKKGAEQ